MNKVAKLSAPRILRELSIIAAVTAMLSLGSHSGRAESKPKIPDGAIVLFSGKQEQLDTLWEMQGNHGKPTWKIINGAAETKGDSIITKQEFEDIQIHVEFKVPYMPEAKGQGRGNSGVIIQGCYEIQVLDSYGIPEPGSGDCGAVYSQAAPLFNACKPPKTWQTYDIVFRAPRFDASGTKTENARVTVLLNGVLVQNNTEIKGSTGLKKKTSYDKPGPLLLQYHNNTVQFRNVWIVPLPLRGALHY